MKAKSFYRNIHSLELVDTCVSSGEHKWNEYMKGYTKGNKMEINKLIKKHLPELFDELMFDTMSLKELMHWNPYEYYKTKTHLILVWSGIEYFLKIN